MVHLVYYEWRNTKRNHTGMAYLAKELHNAFPSQTRLYRIPDYYFHLGRYCANAVSFLLFIKFLIVLKKGDKVFLMEYLPALHYWAFWIKRLYPDNFVFALAHLVPADIEKAYNYNEKRLRKHGRYVDQLLVLGTSLKNYLVEKGIPSNKINVTFHYVDTDFYFPVYKQDYENVDVIFMGSLRRDFDKLSQIVKHCPDSRFHILMGHNDLSEKFAGMKNVKLYSYIKEGELRSLMQNSDISLNVMEDTIGSNVIVTSMATGLAMVVSDVGSIHDYCNDNNAVFCNNVDDFVRAIDLLTKNRTLLLNMKENSCQMAKQISLDRFKEWFRKTYLS